MRKLVLMSIIVASRLLGVLLIFALVARNVTLRDFGMFSACFSVAVLLGFLVDFGFAQSILRDIGKSPESAAKVVASGVSIKLFIAALVFVASVIYMALPLPLHAPWTLQLLLIAYAILNSFAEFYGVSLRALGHYREEAIAQIAYTVAVTSTLFLVHLSIEYSALLIAALKAAQLSAIARIACIKIGSAEPRLNLRDWIKTVKNGYPYALDAGVSNISVNADVLLVSGVLGAPAAGLYQAGQKLLLGMSSAALIFSNIYLPKLASLDRRSDLFRSNAGALTIAMTSIGVTGGLLLFLFGQHLVHFFYGDKFSGVYQLLPVFGCILLVKYLTSSAGVILTSIGKQKVRTAANILSLIVLIILSPFLMKAFGLQGMTYGLLASSCIVLVLYSIAMLNALTRGDQAS